ncbi:MAG: HlyD family efflux transporter periplasmic adaptor subunit [Halanaerobium sp.]|nr:HlyD family efflux transporter periplasmic adaptor subunit [Halanaerobium sp.]
MRTDGRIAQHKKRRVNPPAKKAGRKLLLLLVAFAIMIALGYYLIPDSYYIEAKEEVVEKSIAIRALVVREERIIKAPVTGKLVKKVTAGRRIPAGMDVVDVMNGPEATPVFSYWPGTVFYQFDGLEGELRPPALTEIVGEGINNWRGDVHELKDGQRVNQGQPVCKIVENLFLYLLVPVEKDIISNYLNSGEKLSLHWQEGEGISRRPEKIVEEDGRNILVFRLYDFPAAFLTRRWVDLELVVQRLEGIVIPRDALTFQQGVAGVLLKGEKEERVFQAISIIGEVDDQVVIRGLEPGSQVVVKRR